jgi:hypothetical protein
VEDIDFLVDFVAENSNKLQKLGLEGNKIKSVEPSINQCVHTWAKATVVFIIFFLNSKIGNSNQIFPVTSFYLSCPSFPDYTISFTHFTFTISNHYYLHSAHTKR